MVPNRGEFRCEAICERCKAACPSSAADRQARHQPLCPKLWFDEALKAVETHGSVVFKGSAPSKTAFSRQLTPAEQWQELKRRNPDANKARYSVNSFIIMPFIVGPGDGNGR